MTEKKNVSIKDVALRANVSTATVSHVINGTRFVSNETKQKVHLAMNELNFRINSVARSLRSRKSYIIAFLAPILASEASNFYFMSVAAGVQSVLKERGYHLILSDSSDNFEMENKEIGMFDSQMIDGLIMAPASRDYDYERLFGDYSVVYIDRVPKHCERDSVLIDNKTATKEAVQKIIDKGHRKIALLSGPLSVTTTNERYEGYSETLMSAGLKMDDSLIRFEDVSFESGYNSMGDLLALNPTAIFVTDNVMAMGAMTYLQENSIRIPDQLAVVGFDDFQWTRVTHPPLTVIQQPSFQLGVKTAEVILQRIEDGTLGKAEYRLDANLIVRQSL
ncbi:LacI family transcriptional regulator [Fontibacillus phaseoli]|uniref:LacI family transcriptional regulator n=1 Tax=Fontibacillus phaseoli TaxID=1416533 RepID=A0A369BJ94_9BACL|nr:LacI family DNA-binding transcriptional regulator [Fontibacillus phaseoli]RCX21669.1 LacI family transcriptional regulator [Fontibacillus phaseoli]